MPGLRESILGGDVPALLITIYERSAKPDGGKHPAKGSGPLTLSPADDVVLDGVWFRPALADWPVVRRSVDFDTRSLTTAEVVLRLMPDALDESHLSPQNPDTLRCRIDLGVDGGSLDDVLNLVDGIVVGTTSPGLERGIEIRVLDEPDDRGAEVPGGPVTPSEFPEMPVEVVGKAWRRVIAGPFPYPVAAVQISRDGRRHYLCDPPLTVGPSTITAAGRSLAGLTGWAVKTSVSAGPIAFPYTEIVLQDSLDSLGLTGPVLALGGVGVPVETTNPIELVASLGGIPISRRARVLFARTGSGLQASFQSRAAARDVLLKRLIPQTPLSAGFRSGELDAWPVLVPASELIVREGVEVLAPTRAMEETRGVESVLNSVEVRYGRSVSPFTLEAGATSSVLVSSTSRDIPAWARKILAGSVSRYGVRHGVIEARDLVDRSRAVVLGLAHALLRSQVRQVRRYRLVWDLIEYVDLWTLLTITDDLVGWSEKRAWVTEIAIDRLGPTITVETEEHWDEIEKFSARFAA